MKWPAFLDTTESDAFARELAEEFARHAPATAGPRDSLKQAEQRVTRALEIVGNRAQKFAAIRPLGWYRKSRFMDTLKAGLVAKGLDVELADRIVYAVVLRTARS
jgi:hypothetical protein